MTDTETVLDAPGPQRGPATAADSLDTRTVTTLRFLAADAVQEANSGHPGLPLGMAVPAWVLFSRYLRHDPTDPRWPDRDRFVLSAGHGSMLLYGLLHLFVVGSTAAITTLEFEPGLVKHDLAALMQKLVPDDAVYEHEQTWNDDNGHSHLRSALVGPGITLPFADGRLLTGEYQQVVLIDFDTRPRKRAVVGTVIQ